MIALGYCGHFTGVYISFSIHKALGPDLSGGPHGVVLLTVIYHVDSSALGLLLNDLHPELIAAVIVVIAHDPQLIALGHCGHFTGVHISFSVHKTLGPDLSGGPHGIVFLAEIYYIDPAAFFLLVIVVSVSIVVSIVVPVMMAVSVLMAMVMAIARPAVVIIIVPVVIIPTVIVIPAVVVIPTVIIVIVVIIPAVFPLVFPFIFPLIVPVSGQGLNARQLGTCDHKSCCE